MSNPDWGFPMKYRTVSCLRFSLVVVLSLFIGAQVLAETAPNPTPPVQVPNTQAPTVQAPTTKQTSPTEVDTPWVAPEPWFINIVSFTVLFGSLIAMLFIRKAVSTSKWSLSDALSEETQVTAQEEKDGVKKPTLDTSGRPIMITEMRASASRVIALMGMVVILMMFLGFGTFALYGFAKTGSVPASIDNVVSFLLAGLTLFAPYAVNKFSSLFASLSPK